MGENKGEDITQWIGVNQEMQFLGWLYVRRPPRKTPKPLLCSRIDTVSMAMANACIASCMLVEHPCTGLDSMLAKTYYGGRVKGLADRAAHQGKPRSDAVHECVRGLRDTLEQRRPVIEVKTRYAWLFE